jgi:hypothetical protein
LITERKKDKFAVKNTMLIERLNEEVSIDITMLSQITQKDKYRLREFIDGKTRLLISSEELETIVNHLVHEKVSDFVHQLDIKKITLAELFMTHKRL